jgi:sialate O-acetylesterase
MEWKLDWKVNNTEHEKRDSDYSKIRYFEVENNVSLDPVKTVRRSGWALASPETVGSFSAVAWFFAKHNHLEESVPVGIVDSTWGGTPAEAWTPIEDLLTVNGYKSEARDLITNKAGWQKQMYANTALEKKKREIIEDIDVMNETGVHLSSFDDSAWDLLGVPLKQAKSDVVWLRKGVKLPSKPKSAILSFGTINQLARIYVNGQLVLEKEWLDSTKPITLPSGLLRAGNNVIALRAINDWDNKVYVGKPDEVWLTTDDEKIDLSGAWRFSNTIEPKIPDLERNSDIPSSLYNAMIHPIVGLSIRGVIWYQGENNVERASEYHPLFSTLIQSWRKNWGRHELPFLYVQLASFLIQKDHPSESDWALLREQQYKTLSLPNTGMAVTIDIGEAEDIHPRNKQDVGRRLWLSAKHVAFGGNVKFSGPTFKSSSETNNASLILEFAESKPLNVKGPQLVGFELAGKDGVYYNAKAKLVDKYKVEVSADEVVMPVSVRYAWADNSPANLYDGYDLPAVPFRFGE